MKDEPLFDCDVESRPARGGFELQCPRCGGWVQSLWFVVNQPKAMCKACTKNFDSRGRERAKRPNVQAPENVQTTSACIQFSTPKIGVRKNSSPKVSVAEPIMEAIR